MTPAEIVAIARETLGTPYQHQQRTKGLAMDCAGVPAYIANRMGLDFVETADYGRQPVPALMRAVLQNYGTRVALAEMQLGDIAWLRFEAEPQHLGVIGDYPHGGFSLIHATNAAGINKVVEHRLDAAWQARIVALWRFPGVTA